MVNSANQTRQFKRLRSRFSRFLFLSVAIGVSCLWIEDLSQAKSNSNGSQIAQNAWKYASFPVENFQAYTSGFGYRSSPVDGSWQFHYGLDMAAPLGSYVRNWWTGRVSEVSDNTACGTMLKIQSGEWTHIYCHLHGYVQSTPQGRYLVDRDGGIILMQGQTIPVGARIARVGMTGRTTGPHLHWGLLYNNQYVDPALVIQEMYKQQARRG